MINVVPSVSCKSIRKLSVRIVNGKNGTAPVRICHHFKPHFQIIAEMQKKSNQRSFWMPLVWAGSIVIRARKENRIKNDQTLEALITHIAEFRSKLAKLLHYDWVPVPLVYTQVKPYYSNKL